MSSFGFKFIVPGSIALSIAAACTPDLNSLCADNSCNASTYAVNTGGGGGGGTGNEDGGADNGGAPVSVPVCENGKKDSKESDVDCGGTSTCDRCAKGASCTANHDCVSGLCKNGQCTDPNCYDGIKNQDETDTDCGGRCDPCDLGVACSVNTDCEGKYCKANKCSDHCTSGVKEVGLETDVDCGGTCGTKCADKKSCVEGNDCASQICSNNKCQVPTCSDQTKNQDESDVDCGGACAATSKACQNGLKCNTEADCESWICSATTKKCQPDGVIVMADAIIDNFEDGDFFLAALGTPARAGNWYAYGDSSGGVATEDIAVVNRGQSLKAMHSTGKNFTQWGSGVGVDLQHGSGDKLTWDASAYTGITFWAKAVLTGTNPNPLQVAVILPTIDTDNLVKGKTCTTCDHHYMKTVPVTAGWQRINVTFAELKAEAGTIPEPTSFKSSAIASVQFRMNPGASYELYIDDLAFVK